MHLTGLVVDINTNYLDVCKIPAYKIFILGSSILSIEFCRSPSAAPVVSPVTKVGGPLGESDRFSCPRLRRPGLLALRTISCDSFSKGSGSGLSTGAVHHA